MAGSSSDTIPLFDENVAVLMFFSKSKDVKAGTGSSESLAATRKGRFAELDKIPDWRKKLSNFSKRNNNEPLFTLDGKKWSCVEAYFHAEKVRPYKASAYEEFSLDSGSELSKASGEALKSAGRRLVNLNDTQLKDWSQRRPEVLRKAFRAKFSQNDDYRKILLATYPAKLTHSPGRKAAVTEVELMEIRRDLLLEAKNQAEGEIIEAGTKTKRTEDDQGQNVKGVFEKNDDETA